MIHYHNHDRNLLPSPTLYPIFVVCVSKSLEKILFYDSKNSGVAGGITIWKSKVNTFMIQGV